MSSNTVKALFVGAGLAVAMSASAARNDCWMTGGGSIFDTETQVDYTGRTTHGMVLHCDTRNPNNLQINWSGNTFHMTRLNSAMCPDDPNISPNPPDAQFDTFIGMGEGRFNGERGYQIMFTFTDAGEPGVADTATIVIVDPSGADVLNISGALTFGNHQAHSN